MAWLYGFALVGLAVLERTSALHLRAAGLPKGGLRHRRSSHGTYPWLQKCVQSYADGLENVRAGLGVAIRSHPLKVAHVSPRSDVLFGVGTGTTGTRSFHKALRSFGMWGWHWNWNRNINSTYIPSLVQTLGRWTNHTEAFDVELCREAIHSFPYTKSVPRKVQYVLDTPMAELFLNFFLSFPNAKYMLTTRPTQELARKRLDKGSDLLAPLQEPCGQKLSDFSTDQLAELFALNSELVRCAVPARQLLEIDLWTASPDRLAGLMHELAVFVGRERALLRREAKLGQHLSFPHGPSKLGNLSSPSDLFFPSRPRKHS